MNEEKETPVASTKLATIFLIVLGLHLVVIIVIGAYHFFGGSDESTTPQVVSPESMFNPEEELAQDLEPEQNRLNDFSEASPIVETEQHVSSENQATQQDVAPSRQYALTMPRPRDPLWSEPLGPKQEKVRSKPPIDKSSPLIETQETESLPPAFVKSTGLKTYQVKKGDVLGRIARKHSVSVKALKAENGLKSDMIRIGQVLNIPAKGKVASSVRPSQTRQYQETSVPVVAKKSYQKYRVTKGDTLWRIARNFDTKPAAIAKLNGISDHSKIKIGMVLKIPSPERKETARPKQREYRTTVENTDVAMIKKKKSE